MSETKPEQMTNDELVALVRDWASSYMMLTDDYVMEEIDEIARRLRATTPRTTPPTVEEVGDDEECLVWYLNCEPSPKWLKMTGVSARIELGFAPMHITHWLPLPTQPKGGE